MNTPAPINCHLCGAAAESSLVIIPGGGVRAGVKAVRCPKCVSYIIEDAAIGRVPTRIGAALSRQAAAAYKKTPDAVLEVTVSLINILGS